MNTNNTAFVADHNCGTNPGPGWIGVASDDYIKPGDLFYNGLRWVTTACGHDEDTPGSMGIAYFRRLHPHRELHEDEGG